MVYLHKDKKKMSPKYKSILLKKEEEDQSIKIGKTSLS